MAKREPPPRCGNCRLWLGERSKNGRPKHTWGRCGVPLPEKPALPDCFILQWPPHQVAVWPDDGEGCAFWEARVPGTLTEQERSK